MSRDPVVVRAGITVADFVSDYVFAHPFSTFPVVDASGNPLGLLALRDIKQLPLGEREVIRVEDAAVPLPWVTVLDPDEPMDAALERLNSAASGRALVMDRGRVVGVVAPADIVRRLEAVEVARGQGQ
jgi:CBS domain-containing protein